MKSIFQRMSKLVTVEDLLTPLAPKLSDDQKRESALGLLRKEAKSGDYDPFERYALVCKSDGLSHWVSYGELINSESYSVGQVSKPIPARQIISTETTGLDAAQLFGETQSDFFFVLQSSNIIGTLSYEDMSSAPFKLCLFALTLEIEEIALDVLLQNPDESLEKLGENRRAKASEIFKKRFPKREIRSDLLLHSTTLSHKALMISALNLLPGREEKELLKQFKYIENVRNQCAHTGTSEEGILFHSDNPKKAQLAEFIKTSLDLQEELAKLQR